MRWTLNRMILAGCALLLAAGPVGAAGPGIPVVESRNFAGAAKAVQVGSRLRLQNLQTSDSGEPAALVLERFEVFAPGAKITLHGDHGVKVVAAPRNAYFRGAIDGKPDSRAFVAVLEDGTTQGMISDDGAFYLIGGDPAQAKALGGPLEMHRVDPLMLKSARGESFNCTEDKLPKGAGATPVLDFASTAAVPLTKAIAAHTARVAIETDYEFYQLFNNTTNATAYIGNLIGFASTIYTSELNTSLVVQSVSLWTTGANSDPWTVWPAPAVGQPDYRTSCGLYEFGHYWNVNRTGASRTIAHFLSGKFYGGGVAWLNVLCAGPSFNYTDTAHCPGIPTDASWFGGYGFTANISGQFNINSPGVVWDIYSVSHEIGHNFGSPHSHCYGNIGGNTNPIDQCWNLETSSGCYTGSTRSLPGPAGAGSGTIMSYCHLVRSSYSDITLTFGTNFAYGTQPGREAALMNSYVSSVAAGNPSCLAPVSVTGIFSDGFEGGVVPGPWSGKTP